MTGADFGSVDIDLLADYIGGALEGTPDESAVATLIAEDPAWREAYESLGGGMALVQAELGRMQPEPMPADLAARLDGMFTAPQLTLVPGEAPAAKPRRRRRWTTPIAIAAGVIAFVGFGADYLAGRSDSQSDSVASTSAQAEGAITPATTLFSGIDYTRGTLASEPAISLSSPKSSGATAFGEQGQDQRAADPDPALARLRAGAALQDCFEAIQSENAGGAIAVQSVDYARFTGAPALIVRFTAGNGAWAWAAGPACGTPAEGADTLDKVPVR
ncbi:hypothetical protein [Actinoplanes sp. URMC 104]|uniref:hypothetical protein n=1 Tax=Actinoplanes sp. URMC 104 TaxID=3423409 RepID=UPI003F1A299A